MIETEVKVHGLIELRRKLREMAVGVDQKAVRDALRAGGREIQAEARRKVPIAARPHRLGRRGGPVVEPGFLRSKIRTITRREGSTQHFATVSVGVFSQAFYWRFMEFGTRFIRARPFLRTAFEQKKEEALRVVVERLRNKVEQLAGVKLK